MTYRVVCNKLSPIMCSRQYAKHKSFVGGQVDTEAIEMREESLDGSGEIP